VHERPGAGAARHGPLLVDLERHPASADAGIFSSDFRHANTRGHAIVASLTVARLGRELARRNGGFGAGT
jgi:hypothetical protein